MKRFKKDILWRVYLIYLIFLFLGIAILGKAFYIQFFEGDFWKSKSEDQNLKYVSIKAIRGDICDANGRLMATSVPVFDARMDASPAIVSDKLFYEKIDSLANCLSKLFKDRSTETYKQNLINARKQKNRYYLIKRDISYMQMKKLHTFPLFNKGRYGGGLIVEQKNKRIKPFKHLASRTIGFERRGNYYVGLEGAFSEQLSGISGKRLMRKIAGNSWMPLNDENEIEPQNGYNIITTIDINLQDVVENALLRRLELHEADHGCAVLMEVQTGHIKAIANLKRNKNGYYTEEYNHAIGESIEPGSTFKLASMIALLDDGLVKPNQMVKTGDGKMKFYGKTMEDSHIGGFGTVTAKEVFEFSSNIGISKLVVDNYGKNPQKFVDKLYSMNLHKPLGISIKGEGKPFIKDTKDETWSGISLPWMAHGYEVALTPMQILTLYNAVANSGKMIKPMFVKEIRETSQTVHSFATEEINPSICKESTIKIIKEMLEGVVENGTAKNIRSSLYSIAGKTGTAQIANKKFGYQNESKVVYNSSFAGYFPANDPKYSCIVVINKPQQGGYYGSTVAAPVFKEISDKVYATQLDIHMRETGEKLLAELPKTFGERHEIETILKELNYNQSLDNPDATWVEAQYNKTMELAKLEAKTFKAQETVPDVRGLKAKDAIFLLENSGMEVEISGRGIVAQQSIQPGTKISKGQHIWLRLTIEDA